MSINNTIIESLYKINAIQFGAFTLKSGQTSSIYINLRKIISYPHILREIAHQLWNKVNQSQIDLICGVPYAALPIATCISLEHNIPMVMRRKEKKEYGTKQTIEGVFKEKQRVLIIEDVVTTGGSIIETADDLKDAGLIVKDVAAFTVRDPAGLAMLNKQFTTHTCFTLTEILTTLLKADSIANKDKSLIEKYLQEQV
jgi:orotate phosphoribosyltransferase